MQDQAEATPALPDIDATLRGRFSELYAQLAAMAHRELAGTRRTSLDTVALVNEAFLKLDGAALDVSQRGAFLALAAKAMRHVIVDHVRNRTTEKRGGGQLRVTLFTQIPLDDANADIDVIDIERGLAALAALEPRLVDVVECRFYGGMEFSEIAALLGASERTIYRDWQRARAFLQARLS